jgi:hypothetical protein
MEENDLSMDQLRAVYKAQTEAYLDFNLALINILTKQNELLNKVENLEDITDAEFKNISREYYALEKIFTNFQSAQQIRDNELSNTVEENTAQMSHFGAEFSNLKNEIITKLENELSIIGKDIKQLKTLHFDFKTLFNKAAWTVGGIVAFLTVAQLLSGKTIIDMFK